METLCLDRFSCFCDDVVDGEPDQMHDSAGNQDKMYVNENGEYMIAAPIDEDEQPDQQ